MDVLVSFFKKKLLLKKVCGCWVQSIWRRLGACLCLPGACLWIGWVHVCGCGVQSLRLRLGACLTVCSFPEGCRRQPRAQNPGFRAQAQALADNPGFPPTHDNPHPIPPCSILTPILRQLKCTQSIVHFSRQTLRPVPNDHADKILIVTLLSMHSH